MAGSGLESFIRIKKESTWGTAATSGFWTTSWTSENLELVRNIFQNNSIADGAAEGDPILGGKFVQGSINFVPTYNLMDQFIYGVMGKVTDNTPATGTNTREHWFEFQTSQPSWTIEVNRGDIEANDKVFIFTGCKVSTLELTFPTTGPPSGIATFVGKDETSVAGGSSATTTTPVAGDPLSPVYVSPTEHLQAGWDLGSAPDTGSYCIRSLTVRINRGLSADRFCMGSSGVSEPLPTVVAEVTGEFDIEFKDRNIYEDFKAGTINVGNILFQNAVNLEAALKSQLEFALNRITYINPSQPFIEGPGPINMRVAWRGSGNAGTGAAGTPDESSTKQPIAILTRNLTASTAY